MFTLADIGDGEYGSKWIPVIREKQKNSKETLCN